MNTNVGRSQYANQCQIENQNVLNGKYLLKYERDNKGHRVGVTIAFKDEDGKVKVGWSRCHTKLEPFDKHIGIAKAISRAKLYKEVNEVDAPHPLQPHVSEMLDRAARYFQLGYAKLYKPS